MATEVWLPLPCIPSADGVAGPLSQQTRTFQQGDREGGLTQEHKNVIQNIKRK